MPAHLLAKNLSVEIDGSTILRSVSFEIEPGEMVGLIGPNGSGKTTLLRCLAGSQAYKGDLILRDRQVSTWRPRELARELAFLRQSTTLSFDFTVEQLVMLGRSPHKGWLEGNSETDRSLVRAALSRVELEDFLDRSVLTLSGGELQRALLAQALVQQSAILLLDEPTAHLDIHHQFEFMEIVRELSDRGQTIFAVYHDLELASRFSDRLIVLERGSVAARGAPQDVMTGELIASVFRMQAEVTSDSERNIRIRFLGRTAFESSPYQLSR